MSLTDRDRLELERFRTFLKVVKDAPRDDDGRYLVPASALRYARGEDVNPLGCTGVTARWCPVHGACACPTHEDGNYLRGDLDDPACALHGWASDHATEQTE